MKTIFSIFIGFLIISNANSQSISGEYKIISQDDYSLYFPIETQIALFTPTTDYVCILPTNERDSILQKEVNLYYKDEFIKNLPTLPFQISKVITDKEALHEDLSNINIHAFGTVTGNLWIAEFMKKAKDFPIKINEDTIIADKIYYGNEFMVTALWYNPENFKHSVTLYIPQNLKCATSAKRRNTLQYAIWENGKSIVNSYYHLREGNWQFSDEKDTMLIFRDVNHWEQDNREKINDNYYRFPTKNQLSTCKIDETDIPFDTIKISEIYQDFSNITDMEWLRPIAKDYKVICVGESHHLKYNKYIFKRILFALNTFDYFPLLILELPYSYSEYFNYYLLLSDDKEAKSFSDSVLTKIYEPGISMLNTIRTWNKENPQKKIQIGSSDLEQGFEKTIKLILNPYLLKVDPKADISYSFKDSLKGYLERADAIIDLAKKRNVNGEYKFQTPQYMESIFENLKSSIQIKLDPKNFTDHTKRFQVMIRNVTDSLFLGTKLSEGKTIIYGGREHFRILNDETDKKSSSTEGFYLAHSFKPTKDKVYAINLNTLATSIEDSIQQIDPLLQFRIETDLLNLYKTGKIELNEPVLGFFTNEVDRFVYNLSYEFPNYAFRIKNIKLEKLLNKYEGFSRFMLYQYIKIYSDFNTNIMIPSSPIGDN